MAFTIVFNGLHHLQHNNYFENIVKNFDQWVFVEGASSNTGSTSWCRPMPDHYHKNGHSTDGTLEWLREFESKNKNVTVVTADGWNNKDTMVNAALRSMRSRRGFLWQVDADEQWNFEDMREAEKKLLLTRAHNGVFECNYFFGKDIVAQETRECFVWHRLWNWNGRLFKSHEPPVLIGPYRRDIHLPQRFNHYAYYFPQDVKFKDEWYGHHEGIYERWLKLQNETVFPQHLSYLFQHEKYQQATTLLVRKT